MKIVVGRLYRTRNGSLAKVTERITAGLYQIQMQYAPYATYMVTATGAFNAVDWSTIDLVEEYFANVLTFDQGKRKGKYHWGDWKLRKKAIQKEKLRLDRSEKNKSVLRTYRLGGNNEKA